MSEKAYPEIIEKAKKLALLLKAHPVTTRYEESLEVMKGDRDAQGVLEKMVMLGRDLNEKLQGDESEGPGPAEQMLLKEEMDRHPEVQEHIIAQKDYLVMVQKVQDLIRNPESE